MKTITIFSILGFVLIYFRNKTAAFLDKEFETVKAVRNEGITSRPLIEKLAEVKAEKLLKRAAGNIPEPERKTIRIVLRKRESQINSINKKPSNARFFVYRIG